jgi:hypothetical protein
MCAVCISGFVSLLQDFDAPVTGYKLMWDQLEDGVDVSGGRIVSGLSYFPVRSILGHCRTESPAFPKSLDGPWRSQSRRARSTVVEQKHICPSGVVMVLHGVPFAVWSPILVMGFRQSTPWDRRRHPNCPT